MASSRSPSPALPRSRSVSPTTATTRLILQNRSAALSDSGSEEDDAILRPRGKIAARMQTRDSELLSSSASEAEAEDDANQPRSNTSVKIGFTEANQDGSEDEEGDVITTRPRKLKSRRERTSTPEPRPQGATPSPGLFVSPSKPQSPTAAQSDDDLPSPTGLIKNPRFKALVAKKRQERLAREAEEARKKAERRRAAGFNDDDGHDIIADDEEDDNITDDDGGRKLTQEVVASRPARKASKKALEEMNRETQRLTRSLQLAHEAKVKKKITKTTLFERFNFKPEGAAASADEIAPAASSSRAPTPASAQHSDAEMRDAETPPSSPPTVRKAVRSGDVTPAAPGTTAQNDDSDDIPTLEEVIEEVARKGIDKGKGKATAADFERRQTTMEGPRKRNIRVKLPPLQVNTAAVSVSLDDDDGDDDLQIIPTRKSKLDAIFGRVPVNQAKQAQSLQILRRLAHLDDPDRKAAPPSRAGNKLRKQHQEAVMTTAELQANLLQRARQQARLERDRHLEMLQAKGIHVQTAEEREREMQEVEDMVAKARREAEQIMQRERDAAKAERKKRRDAGEEDPLGWDDESDDEDYEETEEVVAEEKEVELSGSEEEEEVGLTGSEEEDEEEEEEEEEGGGEKGDALVDDAAAVADQSEIEKAGDQAANQDSDDEALPSTKKVRGRARKHVTIVSDDEGDAEPLVEATPRPKAPFPKSPSVRNAESPSVPTSVLRSAKKTFIPGLPVAGPAGLGLTQIFAGTMDNTQMGTTQASPSQPRPTFTVTNFPDSNFSQTVQDASDDMIRDSQPTGETQQAETQGVQIRFSQSQTHGFDSFLQEPGSQSQMSELIELTQDAGFHNFSPLRQRFVEPPASTVDTVPVERTQSEEHNESPLVRRTGKLRRKSALVPASPTRRLSEGEDEVMEDLEVDEFGFGTTSNNAFAAMKEAALKKRKEAFDKKKSKAREMVEEQAEESEDEYAGLGGADGEDSDDSDDQSVKEMIDDETKDNEADERKLAAFYADRERADDEKQVEKLFHDVTTGQLRRKRQGNWDDLSDSDDGGEARRRMKRRQFAKMQRALLADERISKVAENPRNQAFLRTIEDRGSDDEMEFIFAPPPAPAVEGQERQASETGRAAVIPNSQPQTIAAPNPRRTKASKKPSSIGEIRESLSNLLEEPYNTSSLVPATELGLSDDELEDEHLRPGSSHSNSSGSSNKENRNPRRSRPVPEVIDRINLKRSSSTASASNKLAFTNATSSSSGGFRVPALLRRATTNSLLSTSSSTSGTSTTTGTNTNTNRAGRPTGGAENIKIKKPAGKRSGVSYLARETERRAALAEAERRREVRKFRGAEGRVKAVGGLFGGGQFE